MKSTIALLCLTLPLAAFQNVSRKSLEYEEHLRAVRTERTLRFQSAWGQADDGLREEAEGALQRLRARGAPLGSRPSLGALAEATRVLEGRLSDGASETRRELIELADSIDLHVVPGAFEAASSGRGEYVVARVYRLYGAAPSTDIVMTLYWVSPEGEETRARRETVARDAFLPPGFDMYLRAPLAEPGAWQLVAEVASDAHRDGVRGEPVPVECVPELDSRFGDAVQRARSNSSQALRFLAGELQRRLEGGTRRERGLSVSEELRRLEAWPPSGPGPDFWIEHTDPTREGSVTRPLAWVSEPAGDPSAIWLLPAPSQDALGALFAQTGGVSWIAAAESAKAVLASVRFDLRQEFGLREMAARIRRRYPGKPLVLIARGDAVARLSFAFLQGTAPAFDGLVLNGFSGELAATFPVVPTLQVFPGGDEVAGDLESRVRNASGGGMDFTAEMRLPLLVAEWFAAVSPLPLRASDADTKAGGEAPQRPPRPSKGQ